MNSLLEFLLIIIAGLFLLGIVSQIETLEKDTAQCRAKCEESGFKYVKMERPVFFGTDNCWCINENKPKQIY